METTALEAAIVAIVDARIAQVLGGRTHYSTAARADYPPGRYAADERRSRRQARDRIKAHPAHERCGTGKATEWRVAVDAYHAKSIAPIVQLVPSGRVADDEAIAQAAMNASGLRATRKSA